MIGRSPAVFRPGKTLACLAMDIHEPPVSGGTEADTLLGALERQRATLAWKCGGLDAAGLRARLGPSAITLGGLLKHLALVEEVQFQFRLYGRRPAPRGTRRTRTTRTGSGPPPRTITPSLRRHLIDMIEEYARHAGHADLIRESVDGLVGEDPPGS